MREGCEGVREKCKGRQEDTGSLGRARVGGARSFITLPAYCRARGNRNVHAGSVDFSDCFILYQVSVDVDERVLALSLLRKESLYKDKHD